MGRGPAAREVSFGVLAAPYHKVDTTTTPCRSSRLQASQVRVVVVVAAAQQGISVATPATTIAPSITAAVSRGLKKIELAAPKATMPTHR